MFWYLFGLWNTVSNTGGITEIFIAWRRKLDPFHEAGAVTQNGYLRQEFAERLEYARAHQSISRYALKKIFLEFQVFSFRGQGFPGSWAKLF